MFSILSASDFRIIVTGNVYTVLYCNGNYIPCCSTSFSIFVLETFMY
jgi:hypothetical protein